ncbi:methyl-accepting chemotaxis protein [Tepidibacter thalassicus]|uniref:Methyl-accepting chemotaxis sensory transducer with Cache sensor n=1 Tax=Tepidibacter thalassicus DSM 15285 TaxID=1123350 RepID=A0A1M5RK62_9FIRM|nr:methyl-accepting chemotaxis protein [Tepidibacter thalassicus]SHH26611.1 methyl-accepting chemotaxis sensory transducer with Cache sensor [Tepidibacter thalassicus DSM 15285]
MKSSIKTKLIILILALIIIPLVFSGIMSYKKAENSMQKQFKNFLIQSNNQINLYVEEFYEEYKKSAYALSNNSDFQQVIDHPEYEERIMKNFEEYIKTYDGVLHVYMATVDGKFRMYPQSDLESDFDPRTKVWYQKAVENESAIFTDVYEDLVTGNLTITCAVPVYENENNLVGVIGIDVSLDVLSKKISSIKVGEKGYVCIVDSNKKFVSHKNIEKIGQEVSVPEIRKILDNTKDGYVEYKLKESDGSISKKIAAYTRIPELGWTVFSAVHVDEIKKETSPILFNTILITLISLIIASAIGIGYINNITKPIEIIVKDMDRVKNGDLTVQTNVKSNDEIGVLADNFNIMIENVKALLSDAKDVSEEVMDAATNLAATSEEASASAEEISRTVEEIANGANNQAEDAEKGAKIACDLDAKFDNLARNSKNMLKNANRIMEINTLGVSVVKELKEKTNLNNNSIDKIESAVNQLSEKSSYIEGILGTIKSIAEQTNLLALNASIEAARAGEAGRGFAVVADEIRKLAEGSSDATNEIKEILDAIQEESKNTVDIMKEVKEVSLNQTKSVEDVNTAFEKISNSIANITTNIEEVNEYIHNITSDKDLIVHFIENISAVSQETAASSEEVTASVQQQSMTVEEVAKNAEKLNELSLKLNYQIEKFKM